jgi:hypothetical protein
MWHDQSVIALSQMILRLMADLVALTVLLFWQRRASAAEILVLRRQLALYQERGVRPRRVDPVSRVSLAILSRCFRWREALVVVQPATMIRWHRMKIVLASEVSAGPATDPARGPSTDPPDVCENPSWGEERIANERFYTIETAFSPNSWTSRLGISVLPCSNLSPEVLRPTRFANESLAQSGASASIG